MEYLPPANPFFVTFAAFPSFCLYLHFWSNWSYNIDHSQTTFPYTISQKALVERMTVFLYKYILIMWWCWWATPKGERHLITSIFHLHASKMQCQHVRDFPWNLLHLQSNIHVPNTPWDVMQGVLFLSCSVCSSQKFLLHMYEIKLHSNQTKSLCGSWKLCKLSFLLYIDNVFPFLIGFDLCLILDCKMTWSFLVDINYTLIQFLNHILATLFGVFCLRLQ